MARKSLIENPIPDGAKAPRRTLKPLDPFKNRTVDNKHTNERKNGSNGGKHHTSKSYINKSEIEEVCKVTNMRNNEPGIVARLMGITALPLDSGIRKNIHNRNKKRHERSSVDHASHYPIFVHHHEQSEYSKLKPREHPQEEEPQKFKKDFSVWKASGCRDPYRVADVESIQRYAHGSNEKSVKDDIAIRPNPGRADINKAKQPTSQSVRPLSYDGKKRNSSSVKHKASMKSRNMIQCKDSGKYHPLNNIDTMDMYSLPSRIVILKPGPDQVGSDADDCPSSSASSYLEEMTTCIKQGVLHKGHVSSFQAMDHEELPHGRPFDPRKIAQIIANQVRESVARDLEMSLIYSEPLSSFKSNIWPDALSFVNSGRRGLVSESVRNSTEMESSPGAERVVDNRGTKERTLPQMGTSLGYQGGIGEPVLEQYGSCRYIPGDDGTRTGEVSSRHLIRSLSAPVKAESFAKLMEDNHVRRGRDVCESICEDPKKLRRGKLSFREKVSNFRQSFTFSWGLFGRKPQHTVTEVQTYSRHMDDIMSGPTVVRYPGGVHENFTEVPPSPVSDCSSSESEEDLGRFSDYQNHVAPPDLSFPGRTRILGKSDPKSDDHDEQSEAVLSDQELLLDLTEEAPSSAGMTWFRWDAMKEYKYPNKDISFISVGDVVAWELRWGGSSKEDEVEDVGKEVEQVIMEDMVEEMAKEMHMEIKS